MRGAARTTSSVPPITLKGGEGGFLRPLPAPSPFKQELNATAQAQHTESVPSGPDTAAYKWYPVASLGTPDDK